MDATLIKVLQERERLLAQVGQQRAAIASSVAGLATPIALVDRIAGIGRYLRTHPVVVGGLVAAVVAMRTRSVLGVLTKGVGLWRILRQVRSLAHRLGL